MNPVDLVLALAVILVAIKVVALIDAWQDLRATRYLKTPNGRRELARTMLRGHLFKTAAAVAIFTALFAARHGAAGLAYATLAAALVLLAANAVADLHAMYRLRARRDQADG